MSLDFDKLGKIASAVSEEIGNTINGNQEEFELLVREVAKTRYVPGIKAYVENATLVDMSTDLKKLGHITAAVHFGITIGRRYGFYEWQQNRRQQQMTYQAVCPRCWHEDFQLVTRSRQEETNLETYHCNYCGTVFTSDQIEYVIPLEPVELPSCFKVEFS